MSQMSKEYAAALFMLAKENGAEKEYKVALENVSEAFIKTPEYIDFLASPAVSLAERTQMLEKAFEPYVPEEIVSFLCLLCEKGRIREFEACKEEYVALFDFSRNLSVAKVKSAVALNETEIEKLTEKLSKMSSNTVVVECSVDETLKGGIIVELDGKIMDFSLKTRLNEVKDVISR